MTITSGNTNEAAVSITADSLTEASALSVTSASTSSSARQLASFQSTGPTTNSKVQTLHVLQEATSSDSTAGILRPATALLVESAMEPNAPANPNTADIVVHKAGGGG